MEEQQAASGAGADVGRRPGEDYAPSVALERDRTDDEVARRRPGRIGVGVLPVVAVAGVRDLGWLTRPQEVRGRPAADPESEEGQEPGDEKHGLARPGRGAPRPPAARPVVDFVVFLFLVVVRRSPFRPRRIVLLVVFVLCIFRNPGGR